MWYNKLSVPSLSQNCLKFSTHCAKSILILFFNHGRHLLITFLSLKMISSPYCAVSAALSKHHKSLWMELMRIDVIRYELIQTLSNSFSNSFIDFYSCFIKWYEKERSIKLCIHNGGWHETPLVSSVSFGKQMNFKKKLIKQINDTIKCPNSFNTAKTLVGWVCQKLVTNLSWTSWLSL